MGQAVMPITLTEAWAGPHGVIFPAGTFFVESATCGIWDWKTPNGSWGQSYFEDTRPGEDY